MSVIGNGTFSTVFAITSARTCCCVALHLSMASTIMTRRGVGSCECGCNNCFIGSRIKSRNWIIGERERIAGSLSITCPTMDRAPWIRRQSWYVRVGTNSAYCSSAAVVKKNVANWIFELTQASVILWAMREVSDGPWTQIMRRALASSSRVSIIFNLTCSYCPDTQRGAAHRLAESCNTFVGIVSANLFQPWYVLFSNAEI